MAPISLCAFLRYMRSGGARKLCGRDGRRGHGRPTKNRLGTFCLSQTFLLLLPLKPHGRSLGPLGPLGPHGRALGPHGKAGRSKVGTAVGLNQTCFGGEKKTGVGSVSGVDRSRGRIAVAVSRSGNHSQWVQD